MTATDIAARLREVFDPSEYAMFYEVPTKHGTRRCDALAINLWSSKGHVVHGFEIKVSKSDWRAELKQPQKSAEIIKYCHHWWIVAPSGIVDPAELPPNWGLMVVTDKKIARPVKRPPMEAKALDSNILIPIIRRSQTIDFNVLEECVGKRVFDIKESLKKEYEEKVEKIKKTVYEDAELYEVLKRIKTDYRFKYMSADQLTEIFKTFDRVKNIKHVHANIRNNANTLMSISDDINSVLELIDSKKETEE